MDQQNPQTGTRYPDLFAALASSFESNEVKARSTGGRQMHYITARTSMNRLDNVLGPENWWDDYVPGENSVLCRLTIRLPDGSTLTKADAGGYAGMADSGDDDKSGYSDAFKRAAVKFGVGRYLYRDGVPHFVANAPAPDPSHQAPDPGPARAPSNGTGGGNGNGYQNGNGRGQAQGGGGGDRPQGPPRSGKALFAWTKDQEQKYEIGLLAYLNKWAKIQEFPARMVDWDAEMVKLAYDEASRKLQSLQGKDRGDAYEEAISN